MKSRNSIYFFLLSSLFLIDRIYSFELCDISDSFKRSLNERSIFIWSLLDLAESNCIVDEGLFYDELCQASLKLCKEVQQLQESVYALPDYQAETYTQLFALLQNKFKGLPEKNPDHIRHVHAIGLILHYSDYFLKNNLNIDTDIETA